MTSRGFSENFRGSTVLMGSADDRRREHGGAFQRIGGNPQQSPPMRPDPLGAGRGASSLGCYKGVGSNKFVLKWPLGVASSVDGSMEFVGTADQFRRCV